MVIAYESQSTSLTNTVNVPSGTADGDLLVAIFNDGSSEPTAPSGWTVVDSYVHYPAGSDWVWVGYIIVSGTPPASYTWGGATGISKAVIHRFSGVGSYGGANSQANTNSTTMTYPTVTPDEDGSLVVIAGGGYYSSIPPPPVSGYSNLTLSVSRSGIAEYCLGSLVQVTASPTGSVDQTGWQAYSGLDQRGTHLWFRPAAVASTGGPFRRIAGRGLLG